MPSWASAILTQEQFSSQPEALGLKAPAPYKILGPGVSSEIMPLEEVAEKYEMLHLKMPSL